MFEKFIRSCFLYSTIVVFAATPKVGAEIITFNVNLSGRDSLSNHLLTVFGTISVDPALPISGDATASSLFMQFNSDSPIPLQQVPVTAPSILSDLVWSMNLDRLYVTRAGNENNFIGWGDPSARTQFGLLSGGLPHYATYYISPDETVEVFLKAPSGPDGPNGFLIGTAVPEPASTVLVACVGICIIFRRRLPAYSQNNRFHRSRGH